MSSEVTSFIKGNIGEEDVIKTLLISAGKGLVSVAILLGGLLSYFTLCNKYGFESVTLSIIVLAMFMTYHVSRGITTKLLGTELPEVSLRKYKSWHHSLSGLTFNKMLYLNPADIVSWNGKPYRDFDRATSDVGELYFVAWLKSVTQMIIVYTVGVMIVYLFAYFLSTTLYIDAPWQSWITIGTIIGSIIGLSYLFLKLKWKKLWAAEGFNWNLAAWCICSAVIVTMVAFIAGVAIRNIAGFIGIEYTAILVSSYIIMTAIYVYMDIRQWIDRKKHEAEVKVLEEKEKLEREAYAEEEKKKKEIEKEKKEKLDRLLSNA